LKINIKLIVDYAFKRIFGHEKNKKLLIALLNDVMKLSHKRKIVNVELINPFNIKNFDSDKENILDIKAKDNFGKNYDIEVQIDVFISYPKRILFYACKMYSEQIKEGESYTKLKPVISISFLDGILFRGNNRYSNRFTLKNDENDLYLTEDISFFVFELYKFNLSIDELKTPIDEWLYLIKHSSEIDIDNPPNFKFIPIKEILKELEIMNKTELERQQYEDRLKAKCDAATIKEERRIVRKKAVRHGMRKGLKKGLKLGQEEGRKEGRKEAALKIARNLLKEGLSIDYIKKITGLKEEEISNL